MTKDNKIDTNQEPQKKTKKPLSIGWIVFIAIATLILGLATGYYYANYTQQEPEDIITVSEYKPATPSPTATFNATEDKRESSDEEKIKETLNEFYEILKNKEAENSAVDILSLFTDPETTNEIYNYNFYSGNLDGFDGPRLFANAGTGNYKFIDYEIESIEKESNDTFIVEVKENFNAYDNAHGTWQNDESGLFKF